MMTDEDIFNAVNIFPARWIILTGGEPSLHIDAAFISRLKEATGKLVAIETNGTRPLPEGIDWITLSPKTDMGAEISYPSTVVIDYADEIKVVDINQPLDQYFSLCCRKEGTAMYLQPCFVNDHETRESNLQRTIRRVLEDPRWSLSVQLHRFLGIQ